MKDFSKIFLLLTGVLAGAVSGCAVHLAEPASGTSAVAPADTTPPDAPTGLALQTPASSPAGSATPTIRVSGVVSGDTVSLYTDSSCLVGNLKGSAVASGTTVDITSSSVAIGSYTYYAKSVDPSGNASTCSTASVAYQRINAASLSITSHTSPYSFGNKNIGGSVGVVTFTVTNSGGLTATGMVFSGYSGVMTRTNPGGSNCGVSLASGATCQLQITYTPVASTTTSQTLNIAYSDGVGGSGSYDFTITGTGQTPANITLSSSDVDFGTTLGGVPSTIQTVTLTNTGEETATSIALASATDFLYPTGSYPGTATNPCGTTLAGGATCNISFQFVPTRNGNNLLSGMRYENPSFSYQTQDSSLTLNLILRGRSELLRVGYHDYTRSDRFAYAEVDFGEVSEGRTHYRIVTIQNPTSVSVSLDVSGVSFLDGFDYAGGTYPGSGGPGNTPGKSPCGATIIANSECEFIFSFTPSSTGLKVYTMDVLESDSGNAETILRMNFRGESVVAPTCACNPADSVSFGGGTGTSGDPFQVCSSAHLNRMHTDIDSNSGWNGKYFVQCSDLSLGAVASIGRGTTEKVFKGTYDGNFYRITDFRQIAQTCASSYCDGGLFYYLGATSLVKNVHLFGASVAGGDALDAPAGGIAKISIADHTIHVRNVIVTGEVTSSAGGAGGIIGSGAGVEDSFSTAHVYGDDLITDNYIGGLIGVGGTIVQSYSTGEVEGTSSGNIHQGGLIGKGSGVSQSYFIGTVSGLSNETGGLIGNSNLDYRLPGEATARTVSSANFGSVTGASYVGGIFGYISSGSENSYLSNFGVITGDSYVGGIAGYSDARISNAKNFANVLGSSTAGAQSYFGGILGYGDHSARVHNSEVDASITIPANRVGARVGGLAGYFGLGSFTDNIFFGSISNSNGSSSRTGGLVGEVAINGGLANSIAFVRSIDVSTSYGACTSTGASNYSHNEVYYWTGVGDRINGVSPPDYASLILDSDGCQSANAGDLGSLPGVIGWDFSTIWQFPGKFWSELPQPQ